MATNTSSSLQTTLQSTILVIEDLTTTGLNNAVGGPTKLLGCHINNEEGATIWIKMEDSKLYGDNTMLCVPVDDDQQMAISIDIGEALDNGLVIYADTVGGSGKTVTVGAGFDAYVFLSST